MIEIPYVSTCTYIQRQRETIYIHILQYQHAEEYCPSEHLQHYHGINEIRTSLSDPKTQLWYLRVKFNKQNQGKLSLEMSKT